MTETAISTNGGARYQTEKVRVAIVGVGNCASSFVQGVEYYKDADPSQAVPGLMHVDLGGYHVRDIEFTAAFDIDADKVGKDLSEAIWAGQNNTIKFADVPKLDVPVYRGMTHDGLGKYLKQKIKKAPGETDDIVQILKETKTDVVVSYLPVGSEQATKWYVEQVLEAGCGFVNCIPVFIASENYWANRFRKAGLPIVGDDIKSQVGATIVHRTLARLFHDRGVKLARTSQLNVGGNMDFYNMLERERLESKKISKTQAVTSMLDEELPADDVYIGPSDYVPWLTDRKWAHIRLEGEAFGDVPLTLRGEARGVGLAQLGRHRHRRRALLQAGAEPRHRRPARGAELVPDEVAAGAGARLGRARQHGALHRRVRRRAEAAGRRGSHQGRADRLASHVLAAAFATGGPVAAPCRPVSCGWWRPTALRIAQVTPYPWEQHHEVNRFVERLSDELCARGHRVVVVAPSDSRELVREGRARIEAQQHDPDAVFAEPGTRLARGRRPEPARSGAAGRWRFRSTCRARSRTSSSAPSSTSCTCTSRSRRARRRPRCATRAR